MTDTHTQQTNKQWMFTYSLAENLMKRIWGGYWLFWCFNCPLYSLPFGEEAVQLPVHCVPYWQPIPTPHVCILYCAKLRLAPRCPHNQRGMTVGTQPGTQVKMSRSLGAVLKRGLTNRSWHGEAWGQLYCCMSTNDTLRFSHPGRFVRDERCHHLHSDESRVGARQQLFRLLLHPGVGGLPLGADQRTHLRHLEEARMSCHFTPSVPL